MKKVLFSAFAVAAVMTACSKSDVVDAPNIDTPITFEAYSGKVPVSKATSIDNQKDLNQFVVYAYNTNTDETADYSKCYFHETVKFTGEDNVGSWAFVAHRDGTVPVYYWPSDGNKLAFVAYSNNVGDDAFEMVSGKPVINVNVSKKIEEQKDVMVATPVTTRTESNQSVNLGFNHVLSRVHFELTGDEREIIVSSVKIKGTDRFSSKGTIDLTAATPTVVASAEEGDKVSYYELLTSEFTFKPIPNTPSTSIGNNIGNHYMMIIPSDPESVEVKFKFNGDETGSTYTARLNLEAHTVQDGDKTTDIENFVFIAGTSYKFHLTLTSNKIGFTATVNPWVESGTQNPNPEVVLGTEGRSFVVEKDAPAENA